MRFQVRIPTELAVNKKEESNPKVSCFRAGVDAACSSAVSRVIDKRLQTVVG